VEVAVDNLNGRDIRPGFPLIVERAQFQQKGDYKAREKKELDEVAKIRLKVNQEKMFSWNEGDEGEGLRIVILKNMFTPEQVIVSHTLIKEDPTFAHDLEEAVKEECESQVGPIKKIILHEFNPEGVVQIKFNEPKDAEACIALMNGRFFNGKELECFYWDGKTNYRVTRDTHQDQMKRADDFGKWLESNMDNVIEGQNGDEEHESDEDEEMGDGDKTPEEV
jgi:HIV Tat-specific factor 1